MGNGRYIHLETDDLWYYMGILGWSIFKEGSRHPFSEEPPTTYQEVFDLYVTKRKELEELGKLKIRDIEEILSENHITWPYGEIFKGSSARQVAFNYTVA